MHRTTGIEPLTYFYGYSPGDSFDSYTRTYAPTLRFWIFLRVRTGSWSYAYPGISKIAEPRVNTYGKHQDKASALKPRRITATAQSHQGENPSALQGLYWPV